MQKQQIFRSKLKFFNYANIISYNNIVLINLMALFYCIFIDNLIILHSHKILQVLSQNNKLRHLNYKRDFIYWIKLLFTSDI